MQREMCAKYGLPFQEELYVDIDYSPQGVLVPVTKSKMASPEMVGERITRCAFHDERDHNEGGYIKTGFNGQPFSVCIHSDMPAALANAEMVRKTVDQANAQLFPKSS